MNTGKKIQTHITGLRALAIILVITFHCTFDNNSLPYKLNRGFLGVEIFIVIMGYLLISGFITKKDITFRSFVKAKLSRLLFPLSCIICICIFLGSLLLDYTYLEKLAATGLWALFGFSNFELISDSQDYFQTNDSNAMIHTWYLSITFQLFLLSIIYYIIFKNRKLNFHVFLLLSLGISSFLFSHCTTVSSLRKIGITYEIEQYFTSYYALIPRIWEFLAGGLVILLPKLSKQRSTIFTLIGILLIIIPIAVYLPSEQRETINKLCVVTGTLLIIKYGSSCYHLINSIFNNQLFLFLGKISFSLYLIHMPVLVFYKGVTPSYPHYNEIIFLILLSITLAYIFWYFIEKRSVSRSTHNILWGIAVILATLTFYTQGYKEYINVESNSINYKRYDNFRFYKGNLSLLKGYDLSSTIFFKNDTILNHFSTKPLPIPENNQFLFIGDNSKEPSFILIGDSHAFMTYPGLDIHCANIGISGVLLNSFFVPFRNRNVGAPDMAYSLNKHKYNAFIKWLSQQDQIDKVIAVFSWARITNTDSDMFANWEGKHTTRTIQEQMECMRGFLQDIQKIGKKAIIFTPYPRFMVNKMITYARIRARFKQHEQDYHPDYILKKTKHDKKWKDAVNILKGYEGEGLCTIVNPDSYFFKDQSCYAIKGNQVFFFDSNHISSDTAIEFIKFKGHEITNLLKQTTLPSHKSYGRQ